MRKSTTGPIRKYYKLTKVGVEALADFKVNLETIKKPVDQLMEEERKV